MLSRKKYRLRILSVGNDRHFNLSMVVASSKNSDTTADANAGATSNTATNNTCDGVNLSSTNSADCTEVRMVPWDKSQNTSSSFPSHWYSFQKTGVVFDGRPSGVFDPKVRGPAMVQIGTEGGFLSKPVVIKNQPINYEYNVKNILVGNVKEHALLLGPAERADVVVDFSKFAGSTVILYNDAPAALPAGDLRLDYYTGDYDNTDTGGAFSTLPGYGPNTRTIMQFRVAENCNSANCPVNVDKSHPVDYVDAAYLTKLSAAVSNAFKNSQQPIIVPQAAYNSVYGTTVSDAVNKDLSPISGTYFTYNPLCLDPVTDLPVNTCATGVALADNSITLNFQPKSIIEDWTVDYGRMNAMLGVEMPHTTAINQTSIPQGYIDPATELVKISEFGAPISGELADGTQIWKITHNGVDTHPVHFHLFHVQLINRVGWDGAIYPPEENELGWKDTVRMNPLSDTIVALRPKTLTLPFKVGNNHRTPDPSNTVGAEPNSAMSLNFNPVTGQGSDVTNILANYGWEYAWHCHILGHEENDFMRPISVAHQPEAPSNITATGNDPVTVSWMDNSMVANWVEVVRSLSPVTNADGSFVTVDKVFKVLETECDNQMGCARSFVDTTAPAATSVYYQVRSNNTIGMGDGALEDGYNVNGGYNGLLSVKTGFAPNALTPNFAGYSNTTATSAWSATAARLAIPQAVLSASSIDFGLVNIGNTATKAVTLSNPGNGILHISNIATNGAPFAIPTKTCGVTLNPGASCSISVTFSPTARQGYSDMLTVTSDAPTATATLAGIGTAPSDPAAPTAVSVQRTGATVATVTWTDNSNNEASFQIQSSTNGGIAWNTVAIFTSTTAQRTGTGVRTQNVSVSNTTNAVYRVVAVQTTPPTPALTAPSAAPYAGLNNTVVPVAPTNLTGSKACILTLCAVTLNWTDNANNNATYTLQRSTNAGGTWTNVSTTIAGNASSTITTILGNFTNLYRIQAINSVGSSAYSNMFTIVTP